MGFNFYQQYQEYSNIELLKIIKRPADYQPAAVEAAASILKGRQVNPEEIAFIEQYFQDIDNREKLQKEKLDAIKNKTVDFFEPVLQPQNEVEPAKWLNIFLLVLALQYSWIAFNAVKHIIHFFGCAYCSWVIDFYFEVLSLIYIPVVFFLLLRKNRWGWIILFADNLFSLILILSQSYIFFKYQYIHQGSVSDFLFSILIRLSFVVFLWNKKISGYFNIMPRIKFKTAIIASVAAMFFIVVTMLLVQ
jgi:hypothetical protein